MKKSNVRLKKDGAKSKKKKQKEKLKIDTKKVESEIVVFLIFHTIYLVVSTSIIIN